MIERCQNKDRVAFKVGSACYLRVARGLFSITNETYERQIREIGKPVEVFDEMFCDYRGTR